MIRRFWVETTIWAVVAVGTAVLLWLLPVGDGQQGTAVFLFYLLPIFTWVRIVPGTRDSRWLTAAGFVLLLDVVGALLIHYLPGPVPQVQLLGWGVSVIVFPVAFGRQLTRTGRNTDRDDLDQRSSAGVERRSHGRRHTTMNEKIRVHLRSSASKFLKLAVPLVVLIVGLRLPNMGYKELQGDEGIILMRAATALEGDDEELFLHQKGPVEILLPLLSWGSTGSITEFWARWPFLWGNVLAVLVLMVLARRWFGNQVGLVAGILLAVNGFAIAFARIVQYQSFVLLWGLLALLHAGRYREEGKAVDLGLTAVFLAGGLLSHYDAVLVVPAIVWLVWPRVQVARWREWLLSAVTGLGLLTVFYVPYVYHPNFAKTQNYLLGARLGQTPDDAVVYWSGAEVWQMITFYNSIYYVIGLLGLLLVGLLVLRRERNGRIASLLTFLVPLLFYTVIVDDARTHVYTMFPGAVLLAAVGAVWLWQTVSQPVMRRVLVGVFAGFVAVSAVYVFLLFVDTTPERQRTWTPNRPAFYPTTWEEPPLYGLFGFPYQAGWRAVSELPLAMPYASNEEEEITNVYMAQQPRTHCPDFATFILANNVQDAVPYDPAWLDGMYLQAEVVVHGRATMQVYGREKGTAVSTIEANDTRRWLTPAEVAAPQSSGTIPVDVTLGDGQVQLLEYDINLENAVPGGQVEVTLYWEGIRPFTENYQVFTHLFAGEVIAQHDGTPECNINPTTRWEPGQVIPDTHLIDIPPDAPTGPVTLLVGMYNLETLVRLPILATGSDAVPLAEIVIE